MLTLPSTMADGLTLTSHPDTLAPRLTAPAQSRPRENRTRPPDPETPRAGASGSPSQHRSWSWNEYTLSPEHWDSSNWSPSSCPNDHQGENYGNDSHGNSSLVKMSTWAGQPRVEGSSETVRMVLLTCVSIGITYVPPSPPVRVALAQGVQKAD